MELPSRRSVTTRYGQSRQTVWRYPTDHRLTMLDQRPSVTKATKPETHYKEAGTVQSLSSRSMYVLAESAGIVVNVHLRSNHVQYSMTLAYCMPQPPGASDFSQDEASFQRAMVPPPPITQGKAQGAFWSTCSMGR